MKATIENNQLVVRIPLNTPTLSKSGKNLTVASTYGNKQTEAVVNGKSIWVGLNAYIKPS